jgi:CDP-diacylglycerol---serine O-phosphatidyltransferase
MKIKLRRVRRVAIFPALLTLGNLLAGFGAIYFILKAEPVDPSKMDPNYIAALLIFLAMVFDMFDGRIARYTNTASNFGAQLDSLSDLVSFGVTPALLMFKVTSTYHNIPMRFIWFIAAFYVVCAALRLARFNAETTTDESSHQFFLGLPTPGAAAVVASLVIICADPSYKDYSELIIWIMPLLTLVLAALMISRFRYAHFLNRFLRVRPFFQLVEIILIIFLINIFDFQVIMAAFFLLFALTGPISYLRRRISGKSKVANMPKDAVMLSASHNASSTTAIKDNIQK